MFDTNVVREVIYSNIPNELIDRVLVFGSRARDEESRDSDTDICIIMRNGLTMNEIKAYRYKLNSIFASKHRIPTDILIKSSDEFSRYAGVVGAIEYVIALEGVPV